MIAAAGGLSMYTRAQSSANNQDRLVEQYAPLVKRIAYHLLGRLPSSVQVDDLMQAGMIGLLEASRPTPAYVFAAPCLMRCARAIGRHALCIEIRAW